MKRLFTYAFVLLVFFSSCTEEKEYQYGITDVNVGNENGDKNNRKSTTEFISIAYTDVFGARIPQTKLVNLSVVYSSFGDLNVIEERIISNFLNDPAAVIPATPVVNGDTTQFIINCYKKFYNREPSEIEKYFWLGQIKTNASATPSAIYFAMMTSDEYRFY